MVVIWTVLFVYGSIGLIAVGLIAAILGAMMLVRRGRRGI